MEKFLIHSAQSSRVLRWLLSQALLRASMPCSLCTPPDTSSEAGGAPARACSRFSLLYLMTRLLSRFSGPRNEGLDSQSSASEMHGAS